MNLPFFKKQKSEVKAVDDSKSTSSTSSSVLDIIAPEKIEVDFENIKIGDTYFRTLFIAGYPRFVSANWLSPIIDFDASLDIAMYIYPTESKDVLSDLKRKIAEMEATIESDVKHGHVIDPSVQVALDDALNLQEQLAKGSERFFQFGLYFTLNADSDETLSETSKEIESTLASLMLTGKKATLQMEDGFKTTQPLCVDKLSIMRNMDTTSLATTFPFTSSELTANEGIMYGINENNGSLIIFDRFSLENANEIILGKSGSGKSYTIKLEALRALMFGAGVIIIDPEEEYEPLTRSVGGDYLSFSFSSNTHINPFDLAGTNDDPQENDLQYKIGFTLTRLIKLMAGTTTPEEDALIHNALELCYKQKGITYDPATHKNEPPILEDFYKVLIGMETKAAQDVALRLEKFVKGSFGTIFNQRSNMKLNNPFTVFSFKNLEDQLRSLAIFIIVDFIWNSIKRDFKKRILIVDEAWYLMKDPVSAEFLWGFAKRARKYYLGLTTITQDIEDFLNTDLGKTIVTNSSIQILMKQSPAAIDKLAEVFYLSDGEKSLLLSANVGEGLFFAGSSHVAVQVVASPEEHKLISTNPAEHLTPEPAPA
jgi:conjugal transfer ATP-binding protein TraC